MNSIYQIKAVLLAAIMIQGISALSLDDLLPVGVLKPEERQALEMHHYIFRYDENKEGIKMLPLMPESDELRKRVNSLNHNLFIEILTLMPAVGNMDRKDYLLKAYNYMLGISLISGIRYTSSSGVGKELFSEVYRVQKIGSRTPLPDPKFRAAPARWSIKAHMKETNLGRGYYQFFYGYNKDSISLSIVNLTKFQKIFRILNPKSMQLNFLFVPIDNDMVLIYMNCAVKIENERLVWSLFTPWGYFRNRLNILYSWIYKGLVGANAIVPMPRS